MQAKMALRGPVVVTGASGFIATQLISQLLQKGYEVRGTVRSTGPERTGFLTALSDALPGKLTLHEADLLKEGSFDSIVSGSTCVFHTASPFITSFDDPQKDLVDPAEKGTKNVLTAVTKNLQTCKHVVLTSSFAAVIKPDSGVPLPNGKLYDEDSWNDESALDNGPYRYSKVVAEKLAWDMSKQHGFKLVTVLPSLVIGPVIGPRADATSIKTIQKVFAGELGKISGWVCDVRDVAQAHVLALEDPRAQGRYIISCTRTIDTAAQLKAVQAALPHLEIPAGEAGQVQPIITEPLKVTRELGLHLRPTEESLTDMVATMVAQGHIKPKTK